MCACALSPFPALSERIAPIPVPLLQKDLSVDAPGGVPTPAAGRPSERDGRASKRARERGKVASHVERVSDERPAYRPGVGAFRRKDGLLCCFSFFFSSLPSPPSFYVLANEDRPRIEYQLIVHKEWATPSSPSSPSHCLLPPWR